MDRSIQFKNYSEKQNKNKIKYIEWILYNEYTDVILIKSEYHPSIFQVDKNNLKITKQNTELIPSSNNLYFGVQKYTGNYIYTCLNNSHIFIYDKYFGHLYDINTHIQPYYYSPLVSYTCSDKYGNIYCSGRLSTNIADTNIIIKYNEKGLYVKHTNIDLSNLFIHINLICSTTYNNQILSMDTYGSRLNIFDLELNHISKYKINIDYTACNNKIFTNGDYLYLHNFYHTYVLDMRKLPNLVLEYDELKCSTISLVDDKLLVYKDEEFSYLENIL